VPRRIDALPIAEVPAGIGTELWRVFLDVEGGDWVELGRSLPPDERQRAARLRFDRDRRRFIRTRTALREILSDCLGVPACQIAFRYGSHGKPEVAGTGAFETHFNVSHSEGLAVIAVVRGHRVGVDIERVQPGAGEDGVAEQVMSGSELARFHSVPTSLRDEAFIACWTRKEAYLKALGVGISDSVQRCSVSFLPGERPEILECRDEHDSPERWSLVAFSPAAGFVGAVAVEAGEGSVSRRGVRIP
jgi:4'-phosphopantetheinyl transferase